MPSRHRQAALVLVQESMELEMDAPEPRAIEPPGLGPGRKLPEVGGMHHHYERRAA